MNDKTTETVSVISAAIAALEPSPPPPPVSLTLRGVTVARVLGVSYRTLMRRPQDFPRAAFGAGKNRRWFRADVERWLRERAARA